MLLVEILRSSTEAYDRGAKLAHCRALPSLKAVLFVRQSEPGLELFARRDDGTWELHERTAGTLRVAAIEVDLDVAVSGRSLDTRSRGADGGLTSWRSGVVGRPINRRSCPERSSSSPRAMPASLSASNAANGGGSPKLSAASVNQGSCASCGARSEHTPTHVFCWADSRRIIELNDGGSGRPTSSTHE